MCALKYRRPRLCRLCECPVVDDGVPLSKPLKEKVCRWWKAHFDTDLERQSYKICHFCGWDLRFADENSEEKEPLEQNWWPPFKQKKLFYHHYNYYKDELLKPCSVKIVPIADTVLEEEEEEALPRHHCIYCPRRYATFEHLLDHTKRMHAEEKIRCDKSRCRTFFHTLQEKLEHLKKEHPPEQKEAPIKCLICGKKSSNMVNLKAHLYSKHRGQFFRCKLNQICSEIFKTEAERDQHFVEKHNYGNYFCCFCNRYFENPASQRRHLLKFHADALKCNFAQIKCPNYFKTEEDRQRHIQEKHLSENKLECFYCSQRFTGRSNLQAHIKQRHQDIVIKCNIRDCLMFFRTEEQIQKHFEETHKEHQFFCIYCDKTYFIKSGLSWHLLHVHSKEEVIRCHMEKCKTYFKTEEDKLKHVREVHQIKDKKLSCVYCGKFFASVKCMKMHVKSFHSKISIRCKFNQRCLTFFKTLEDREKHIKEVHQAEKIRKPVQCLYCDRISANLASFKAHVLKAHKEFAIKCPFPNCGQYFKSQEDLEDHFAQIPKHRIKVEKSAKSSKFSCPMCPKKYKSKGDLTQHQLLVHQGQIKGKCPHCQKVLLRKTGQHIITDLCRICNQKFLCVGLLAKHKLICKFIHKCPVCTKIYKQNYELQAHCRNVHTAHIRQWRGLEFESLGFKCDQCCIYFRTKDQVPQHFKRRHTVSISTCDICQKQFQNKRILRLHIAGKLKSMTWKKTAICVK